VTAGTCSTIHADDHIDSKKRDRSEEMTDKVLLTPSDLSDMMASEKLVLIDTRNPASYAAAHLPGAVNIHDIFTYLATSTPEGVAAMREKFAAVFGAAGLSGDETAVVYEQSMDTGFGQSCRGYVLLTYLGYPKVKILHGGFAAWAAAGLPTTTQVPTPTPATFPLDPSAAGILVDLAGMKAAVADPNIVKLDTRDVDEWIADSSSPYGKDFCPRKGRIPGAKWVEWYRMMKPSAAGPMFKSREEILAECASVGVTPKTPVVLYCFKGARASNTLVALKEAGIENVTLYFGSWNEWSRDPSLPIETGLPYKEATAASVAA
jgi:thiosulfate/3-mercaptopyruvate sulfurtransferase